MCAFRQEGVSFIAPGDNHSCYFITPILQATRCTSVRHAAGGAKTSRPKMMTSGEMTGPTLVPQLRVTNLEGKT